MNPIVIDCSVAMAWCFTDEATPYTEGILDLLENQTAIVPDVWHLEVANILLVGERRKRITPAQSKAFIEFLSKLPIRRDTETSNQAFGETLLLARAHNLSSYDAAYLELASRQDLSLASLDGPLVKAAKAAGVTVLEGVHNIYGDPRGNTMAPGSRESLPGQPEGLRHPIAGGTAQRRPR